MKTILLCSLLAAMAACSGTTAEQDLKAGDVRKTGTIQIEVSCRPEVKADFEQAVALLHSFFYEEARRRFLNIAERDPQCAMAWWGVAMTWYHPLWAPPTPEEMRQGAEAAMNKFNGGEDYADFDRNNNYDLFDFLAFVNAFNAGCD